MDRIAELCRLFDISADILIRDDLELEGLTETDPSQDPEHPLLSLDETYAYVAQNQTVAHKLGLGVAACIVSPALITLLSDVSERMVNLFGLPVMFLLIAWAVWQFITVGSATERYKFIEKRRFTLAPDAQAWVISAQEQFRPALARDIAFGVVLCIVSPLPIIFLESFLYDAPLLEGCGPTLLLVLVALGVYLFVHSGTIQGCYHRLLKERD